MSLDRTLWSRSARLRLGAACLAVALIGTGCWEQWTVTWWPQMKWQKAVQAFEESGIEAYETGTLDSVPPEGAVPVEGVRKTTSMTLAETEALTNPRPADLDSLNNGREQFAVFCYPCHGAQGGGDGPVAGPPFGKGPLVGVLPIGGPTSIAKALTDGHIYTTISQGRGRMPSYSRIPPEHRWDIVNWVRYLNGQVPAISGAASNAGPEAGLALNAEGARP